MRLCLASKLPSFIFIFISISNPDSNSGILEIALSQPACLPGPGILRIAGRHGFRIDRGR